jgi:hypothetical protein
MWKQNVYSWGAMAGALQQRGSGMQSKSGMRHRGRGAQPAGLGLMALNTPGDGAQLGLVTLRAGAVFRYFG